jgi:glycosyltransferase involved in cell wall biosynthesis
MTLKIAYFTGEYPRATDTFIQREVMGLRKLGVDIQTFAVRKPSLDHLVGEEQRQERERTTYLLPPNLLQLIWVHLQYLLTAPNRYWQTLKLAIQTSQPGLRGFIYQIIYFLEAGLLASHLQRQQISHLHNHIATSSCTVAMLASTLGNTSFSFTLHGPHTFFEPYRWCLGEKIKQSAFVACISDFCRSQAMIFAAYEDWSKLKVVHCGVDFQMFTPNSHTGEGNNLLYVGRLAFEKGLPILLEAMQNLLPEHPNLTLTVIGDGPNRTFLEQQAEIMGLADQVKFLGYQSQTAVRDYLKQTDIFVLPSFAEGVPVVLMEALASGVPVIATRIAGISELVEDNKSGYLVAPGNAMELAEKIHSLWLSPETRQTFGHHGHEVVQAQFNISHETQRLRDLLIELVS